MRHEYGDRLSSHYELERQVQMLEQQNKELALWLDDSQKHVRIANEKVDLLRAANKRQADRIQRERKDSIAARKLRRALEEILTPEEPERLKPSMMVGTSCTQSTRFYR